MSAQGKFLPVPTPETEAFWAGCRNGELLIQRCSQCGEHQFYPRIICASCESCELDWVKSAGTGNVRSFTIVRHPVSDAYAEDVPYVIALVALDEGPTIMSIIAGCTPESVKIGMPVSVFFEAWSEEISMPKFKPAA